MPRLSPLDFDQRVTLHGVSWQAYEALLAWRGDRSVPRMTYLEGELELLSPARRHETDKTRLARLLEAWAEETGTPFEGAGSWTVKNPDVERAAEADECPRPTSARCPAEASLRRRTSCAAALWTP